MRADRLQNRPLIALARVARRCERRRRKKVRARGRSPLNGRFCERAGKPATIARIMVGGGPFYSHAPGLPDGRGKLTDWVPVLVVALVVVCVTAYLLLDPKFRAPKRLRPLGPVPFQDIQAF
jgi:hypothetical protein